jgi:hypothetical protein
MKAYAQQSSTMTAGELPKSEVSNRT